MNHKEETLPVTVITVVRNGERYLAQGLKSVFSQTMPPAEIIVVDGQSEDATAEIARSFPGVAYLRQPDLGLANARNQGIQAAAHDLVAFLDHDDLWAEDKLARQVETMCARPDLQYTTTLMRFIFDDGVEPGTDLPEIDTDSVKEAVTPSALLVRKELFTSLGLFDPTYQIGCDADWFARARDYGVPTATVPEVLLYKRFHGMNLSRDGALNRKEMFRILRASLIRQDRL